MTPRKKAPRRPADENRLRRLSIIAELDRLMSRQLDPAFTGNVEIQIPAKAGRIGEPKFSVTRFGVAPE